MTICNPPCDTPSVIIPPSIHVAPAVRVRRVRTRRLAGAIRSLRAILAGWTRRPSDEALTGLAARDRIGERF